MEYTARGDTYQVGRYHKANGEEATYLETTDSNGNRSCIVLDESETDRLIEVLQARWAEMANRPGSDKRYQFNGYTVKIVKRFSDGESVKVEIVEGDQKGRHFVCMRSELTDR